MEVALILRPRGALEGLLWAPYTVGGRGRGRPGCVAPTLVPSCSQMLQIGEGGGGCGDPLQLLARRQAGTLELGRDWSSPLTPGVVSGRAALGSPQQRLLPLPLPGCLTPGGHWVSPCHAWAATLAFGAWGAADRACSAAEEVLPACLEMSGWWGGGHVPPPTPSPPTPAR